MFSHLVSAPAITFLSMSKGEGYRREFRSFYAVTMVTELFGGVSEECRDRSVSGKDHLLSPGRVTELSVPKDVRFRK